MTIGPLPITRTFFGFSISSLLLRLALGLGMMMSVPFVGVPFFRGRFGALLRLRGGHLLHESVHEPRALEKGCFGQLLLRELAHLLLLGFPELGERVLGR